MSWLDPQTWDWATLVKTFIAAGFGTAFMQGSLAIYRDRCQRKSRAAYMAMQLAWTIEAYARACSDFISDNKNVQPPGDEEEYPQWRVELPELASYPENPDGWQAIDSRLAARCLSLRDKIQQSQRIISSTIEYDMDDLGDTLDEQAAGCGLEALKLAVALRLKHQAVLWRTLAKALRLKHGVGKVNTGWDYAEHLESTLRRAKKAKEERRERNSQHALDLSSLMAELTIDIDEQQSCTPEHH